MCPYKQWEIPRFWMVSISRLQYYTHFKIPIPVSIHRVELELKDRFTKLKESMSFFSVRNKRIIISKRIQERSSLPLKLFALLILFLSVIV